MSGFACAVVGAQYGSEGKGAIVAAIAHKYNIHVRTGGPNAGHTFYDGDKKHVMQSVPCGWINPEATLVVGRGAVVEMETLCRELLYIESQMPGARSRVMIDPEAHVITAAQQAEEGGTAGEMHKTFGSTGKGVGACRHERIRRAMGSAVRVKDVAAEYGIANLLVDTVAFINSQIRMGASVLLEGTQGSGLSLVHGPWPHVTSGDTNAAQLAADCGLAPQWVKRCILVARTMPIRVGGKSGHLKNERTWDEISERLGKDVCEITTVTKIRRRICDWDTALFERALMLNAPSSIAVTFTDYIADGSDYGVEERSQLSAQAIGWISINVLPYGVPLSFIKTGEQEHHLIDMGVE